ncbi:aminotransferase class V-fold PLP-dependent enzyme [Paenibacillus sp. HWE-109]|uniref:aminotransferase class V-fold PLP-dependent enzyme n=1 Tax=Paenibacillus sp. HWE-109 TaxID=1306526 RepID=UPI001EDF4CE3|nr:aminotransferase class V-fold PLP-dependent enzyme [Paenibacillus sp. HWE-109]UKS26015.1 aminotransferase class V-fold PLP-dependent enzyme [Paenibacillus sp. HWE-109]
MKGVMYFDQAASSWPKPPAVMTAMMNCMEEFAANPGRGSHQMAVKASRVLFETRKHTAKLFGVKNPNDISFALNTTHALNQAIKGFVKPGDHVICTNIEHNSVRRPLEYLKATADVELTYIQNDQQGYIHLEELRKAFKPNTTLVVVSHSSNLLGTIMPVGEIGELCRSHGARLLIDAAQSAGILPIDVQSMNIDMLAFPGHKGLLGPQGTGGLYINPNLDLDPLLHGGTGSQSEAIQQPTVRPDRYEAGTQNTVGIAGLNEGVKFVLAETVEKIHEKEWRQTQMLMEGLLGIGGVTILGPSLGQNKTGIVSFNIQDADSSEVAFILDQSFQIAVRSGYHCTPLAHEAAGTLAKGAVRASIGYFTTDEEVNALIQAVKEIHSQYAK